MRNRDKAADRVIKIDVTIWSRWQTLGQRNQCYG
jgi:hypothetical protein